MRSPKDMEFIQIDITNACNMSCSNCTRFCGNHAKPFFMDFDTFKKAVDSLVDFDGVVGVIGGEPTIHPEFEKFANYMVEKLGEPVGRERFLYPQSDFICSMHQREYEAEELRRTDAGKQYMKKHGAGLWSNMSETYKKHYETIQDTFSVQYLNDHINPSYHQPGLVARKDLGIKDDEWLKLRDNCWVQNTWSATITPKGAFFCEIAGALDMLFDGPGGWPIEGEWWKRTPEEFGDQLHWCELCGFALEGKTFTRDSQEGVDDVSPSLYKKLEKIDSPKLKKGKINKISICNGKILDSSKPEDRRYVIGDRYIAEYKDRFHRANSILFNMKYIEKTIPENGSIKIDSVEEDWILIKKDNWIDTSPIKELIGNRIFNPGVLIKGEGYLLFNKNASSLKKIDKKIEISSVNDVINVWNNQKVINVDDIDKKTSLTRKSIMKNGKYIIWGAGMLGELFAEMLELSGGVLVGIVDKSKKKEGNKFLNMIISNPYELFDSDIEYDYLMIAHHLLYEDILNEALEIGIPREKIILPYEL